MEFRLKIVKSFLQAGAPLSQIDDNREVLKEISGLPLTHSSHLKFFVDIIHAMQEDDINILLKQCRFALQFTMELLVYTMYSVY